jgi:hypothetical protein
MDPSLPFVMQFVSAVVIFGVGIFLVAAHTLVAARAAERSPLGEQARWLVPMLVGAFLAGWLGLSLTVGDGTNFPFARPDRRLISLAVGFGPMLVAIALIFSSRVMRTLNTTTPSAWLIWIQTYRVAGLMFLYPFFFYGLVPAGFAVPAAVGDALTAIFAPIVGTAVERRRRGAVGWAIAWNVFGILDLIVAPAAAVLSEARVLGIYPLALVPLFIGPPVGILTHIYSLRNLAASAVAAGARSGTDRPKMTPTSYF